MTAESKISLFVGATIVIDLVHTSGRGVVLLIPVRNRFTLLLHTEHSNSVIEAFRNPVSEPVDILQIGS